MSVVATNVDAVREMIERDRHITYCEIQASLGIDMKAIHTILHDHLSVRKLCSHWIPYNLTEAQKQARVKWSKEMLKKFNRGQSNLVYNIVTGNETSIHMSPKINNNPLFGYFKINRNQQKLFVHAVLSSK